MDTSVNTRTPLDMGAHTASDQPARTPPHRQSLVFRLALVVGAIALAAVVSLAVTLAMSRSLEGNATAINQAGALRMGLYRLLAQASETTAGDTGAATLNTRIDQYSQQLQGPALRARFEGLSRADAYTTLISTWQSGLEPALRRHTPGTPLPQALTAGADRFVTQVDGLVSALEQRTEQQVRRLHLLQTVCLVLAVISLLALTVGVKRRVLRPLRTLVGIARAVSEGDFSRRAGLRGADELAELGGAMDQMSGELALTYQDLEARVRHKTEELEKSRQALELLHSASRNLFANHDLCRGAVPMLQQLERLLGIGPIHLYLHDRHFSEPVQAVTTASRERPFYCRDHNCNACLTATQHPTEAVQGAAHDGHRLLLPIRTPGALLGTLEVWYPADRPLSHGERRLLETLSDQLATALFLERQITEEQQLTLAEERTVIARELHDSLAQSLSYLKMQVARLRRLDLDSPQKPAHDDILNELSTGLNSAYRQLRELLATFRLKLDTPDLATALGKTIDEFSERHGRPIPLHYNLPPHTLSPNEEIHTLQIVREALANAVKHAEATDIDVEVRFDSPQVRVRVRDNGRGLPDSGQPMDHYGLIIMQDRARTLGGEIRVENRDHGGVHVDLAFVPKARNLIPATPN